MKQCYLPALLRLPREELWLPGPKRDAYMKKHFLPALPHGLKFGEHEMKQNYLPAILPTTLHDKWRMGPMNWLDPGAKETGAYYPNILISFYHWRSSRFDFDDDVYIFGDSGGYSVATLGAEIDPIEVMWWQIKNCTAGCLLDVPPFVSVGAAVLGGNASSNWKEALRVTIENTKRALPVYLDALDRGESFRWWGVVHGETDSQLEEWYARISEIYPFDHPGEGWALKPHPANNPISVARLIRFAAATGIKRAHFLQMTGLSALTTLFALGPRSGLEYASFDSAAASFSGINRTVFVPSANGLFIKPITEKFREGETFAQEILRECPCRSCQWLREELENVEEVDYSEYWKYRMIFHNTLIAIQTYENIEKACQEDYLQALKQKLKHRFGPVMRALEGVGEGLQEKQVPLGTPQSFLDLMK